VSRGLLHSAQTLLAGLLGLARTRIELFSTELQEELARLATALIGAIVVALLALLGVGFAAAALILSFAPEHRLAAAGVLATLFLALALAGAWALRGVARAKPRMFDATLAELERDYQALKP